MKRTALCTALLLAPLALGQQGAPSQNPVTDTVRNLVQRQSKNLTAAAEEMPADKYSYKPTAQQMSFGTLVGHIVESNNFLCSKISGTAAPSDKVAESDPKDKLVDAMKKSFDYCNTAMANVKDAQLSDPVELWGGRKANKAGAVIGLTNDWADHYGAAAMYLRLNGMLPPTAKRETANK